jgi:hypothetical protein
MTHSFKLSRRIARLRIPTFAAVILALGACDNSSTEPSTSALPEVGGEAINLEDTTSLAGDTVALRMDALTMSSASFAGGIPFGLSALPTTAFGSRYNGAMRNNSPDVLVSQLAAIRSRGGKVALMFAGNEQYYKDGDGHFSFTKWKQRIDRFRHVNFSSYVSDGTVIGHYMIDEPNDPANWNGRPVPASTLDDMGAYSKSIWPNLPTIVRTEPAYFSFNPRHVDAAWAQYLYRRGDVGDYIRKNVADAQRRGLALVVGINVLRGSPTKGKVSASQLKSWGSTLLSSSYPCAFISWQYNSNYLDNSSIRSAMDYLRNKAENRSNRSCRGS